MDNPFADPSVVEAQRAAAQAPAQEDNPFADDVGKFFSVEVFEILILKDLSDEYEYFLHPNYGNFLPPHLPTINRVYTPFFDSKKTFF